MTKDDLAVAEPVDFAERHLYVTAGWGYLAGRQRKRSVVCARAGELDRAPFVGADEVLDLAFDIRETGKPEIYKLPEFVGAVIGLLASNPFYVSVHTVQYLIDVVAIDRVEHFVN